VSSNIPHRFPHNRNQSYTHSYNWIVHQLPLRHNDSLISQLIQVGLLGQEQLYSVPMWVPRNEFSLVSETDLTTLMASRMEKRKGILSDAPKEMMTWMASRMEKRKGILSDAPKEMMTWMASRMEKRKGILSDEPKGIMTWMASRMEKKRDVLLEAQRGAM